MKKLEEIIEENIGDKKYLWIRIPTKKGNIFERQEIGYILKEYFRLNNATVHCNITKPPQFVYVNRNKEVFFKIHPWIKKELDHPNEIEFNPNWLFENKNQIILHIPHSSIIIPEVFYQNNLQLKEDEVSDFNLAITDLYVDELFPTQKYMTIKAPLSRVYCDVERFEDDEKEEMSQYGMGVVYSKTHQGKKIFNLRKDYKEIVLSSYYRPYHEKLDAIIKQLINFEDKKTILIDCHSFSKDILINKDDEEIPDICLSMDSNYYNEKLLNFTKSFFERHGYKVKVDFPYKGSMVPNYLIENKKDNFASIMIEINKNLYLEKYERKTRGFTNLYSLLSFYLCFLETENI